MLNVQWFLKPALQVVAERRGFLTEFGVKVQGSQNVSSDDQFADLRDGRQDAVVTALDNVIMWNRRPGGGNFRIIAQSDGEMPVLLYAQPGYSSIAELEGKPLLVDSDKNGFVIALLAMLDDAGVDHRSCELICIGGVMQRYEALVQGRGEATLIGPPFDAMADKQGLKCLGDTMDLYPGLPSLGIIARENGDAGKKEEIVAWLAALEKARLACKSDPEAAIADLVATGLPPEVARLFLSWVPDTMHVAETGMQILTGQRKQLGLPGGDDKYQELVNPTLLEEALAG